MLFKYGAITYFEYSFNAIADLPKVVEWYTTNES